MWHQWNYSGEILKIKKKNKGGKFFEKKMCVGGFSLFNHYFRQLEMKTVQSYSKKLVIDLTNIILSHYMQKWMVIAMLTRKFKGLGLIYCSLNRTSTKWLPRKKIEIKSENTKLKSRNCWEWPTEANTLGKFSHICSRFIVMLHFTRYLTYKRVTPPPIHYTDLAGISYYWQRWRVLDHCSTRKYSYRLHIQVGPCIMHKVNAAREYLCVLNKSNFLWHITVHYLIFKVNILALDVSDVFSFQKQKI